MNDTLTLPVRYRVPALERGLRVLQLFRHAGLELTPPEIARTLALPRTTVFRLLQTLEDLGFVERSNARAFRLGPAAAALGTVHAASSSHKLAASASGASMDAAA